MAVSSMRLLTAWPAIQSGVNQSLPNLFSQLLTNGLERVAEDSWIMYTLISLYSLDQNPRRYLRFVPV